MPVDALARQLAGDFTPLTDEERKALDFDTPYASSKDPAWSEGSPKDMFNSVDTMLRQSQEQLDMQHRQAQEALRGRGEVVGGPLPEGRVRMRKDLPAAQEYLRNLPDDVTAHDMGNGYLLFKLKPGPKPPLVSSLATQMSGG